MKVCLSRMSRKGHVRFLGEGKKAISLPYPTCDKLGSLLSIEFSENKVFSIPVVWDFPL